MEITLKKARRLEQKIGSMINDLRYKDSIDNSVIVSNKDHDNVDARVLEGQAKLSQEFNNFETLNKIRYSLRAGIGHMNESSGLNDLMTEEAMLVESLDIMRTLITGGRAVDNEYLERCKARLKDYDPEYGFENSRALRYESLARNEMMVQVVTEEFVEQYEEKTKEINNRLEEIKDECARLNLSTKFELADKSVKALQKNNLL